MIEKINRIADLIDELSYLHGIRPSDHKTLMGRGYPDYEYPFMQLCRYGSQTEFVYYLDKDNDFSFVTNYGDIESVSMPYWNHTNFDLIIGILEDEINKFND